MIKIDLNTPVSVLQEYLEGKGWLQSGETVLSITKPGEGNMNVVLRITTDQRSFILKQSRPYVQKYQQIPAPLDRIAVEYQFYNSVTSEVIAPHIPVILSYEPSDFLLAMEDLGPVEDMTQLYVSRTIPDPVVDKLITILLSIHASKPPDTYPLNLVLRQLNHQHIFVLPFLEGNGFQLDDIQQGLQGLAFPYKTDTKLKDTVEAIGNQYLAPGKTLLHGDYYPGSWMTVDDHVYVIDPEFSFMGFAEFDLGVMTAHCIMATMDPQYLQIILGKYPGEANARLVEQLAGIEIIRRLIGLAQLPLNRTLQEKDYLLQQARKMILG